ncbi:MAG: T9SS type A sorting domain-containing protein, partial [Bacteroidia bacterium]|nr:T9SS type A sorting domain-containing protein [Bacteroidia bacterium]
LMTEQDTISITDTIIDLGEISSTAIQLSSERFTVPDQDQYYIAFQVYSGPDKWILAIDDIEVTIIPDGPACSGADTLTATSGTFEDGSGLFDYGNNSDCSWLIAPSGATSINLTFDFFNIEYGFDTLFVHDGASTSAPLLAAYTDAGLPNDISSSGGEMLVRFVTNDQNTSDGWEISYTSNLTIFCSGTDTFTTSTGIVSDGSGAYDYNNNADCKWLIQPAGAASIDLSFKTFDTEADADSVFVYDGGTTSDSLLGVFSGTNLPGNLSSSAGTMLIHFKTDNDSTQAGWKAKYTSKYEGNCEGFYYFTASYDTIGDGSDSSNYANNSNCEWLIQPSGASSITLTFLSFETQTLNDKVIVYDGEDETGTILGTFSGDSLPSELKSTAGQMFVQFISDDTITAKGWQAVYDAEFLGFCSGLVTLTKPSGTFGDGSGSGKYANNSNCKWLLQPGGATSITLNFNYFKTEDKLDRVIVYDGTSDNDPLLGSYSGSDLPPSLTSSGGAMYLQFFSDEMVNTSGWEASYCTPTSLPLAVASIDQIICRGDSAQLSASGGESYSWSPTMGLDNHAISNPIAKPDSNIVYVVTVKNEDGCSNTDSLMITVTPIQENICFVTIDSSSADNLIVWEKINMDKVESYNIYKEGSQSNVYDLIGNVSHSDLSIFLDTTSNPKQRSYRYTLSVLDSCGNESGLSSFHKTMHLTVNLGVNDVINLIWENYEGFTFSTYRIWRGTSDSNFVILDSIPGNITTFTDDQPPVSDSLYYQLEILHPVGCEATAKRARGYGSARSNTANMANPRADTTSDTTVVISHYYNENNFKIYPNPYKDHTNISYTLTSKQDVQIEIYNLLSKKIYTVVSQKQNKGYYNYEFSAGKLEYPSGIYILKAEFGNTGRFSKQLIELK